MSTIKPVLLFVLVTQFAARAEAAHVFSSVTQLGGHSQPLGPGWRSMLDAAVIPAFMSIAPLENNDAKQSSAASLTDNDNGFSGGGVLLLEFNAQEEAPHHGFENLHPGLRNSLAALNALESNGKSGSIAGFSGGGSGGSGGASGGGGNGGGGAGGMGRGPFFAASDFVPPGLAKKIEPQVQDLNEPQDPSSIVQTPEPATLSMWLGVGIVGTLVQLKKRLTSVNKIGS